MKNVCSMQLYVVATDGDRELSCVSVQPEILRVDAHYSQSSDPGLPLILFALVRSNPPATIRWVDQSGQLLANSSDFLILDSRSFPWLTNHSLQLTLSSLSGNITVNANNSLGSAHSNLTLTGDELRKHLLVMDYT